MESFLIDRSQFESEFVSRNMPEPSISQALSISRSKPATPSTFPAELIIMILKAFEVGRDPKLDHLNAELDQITSMCLGLTCKILYKIHKSLHPDPIKLRGSDQFPPEFSLATRLRSWMPSELVYNHVVEKFFTPERDEKINLEENRKDAERWMSISQARTMIMDAMQCSVLIIGKGRMNG